MDRFDERAAELIGCSIPGVCKGWAGHPIQFNGHLERCTASLRPTIAEALREAAKEGAKRARREAFQSVYDNMTTARWDAERFADWLFDELAAKEEEAP